MSKSQSGSCLYQTQNVNLRMNSHLWFHCAFLTLVAGCWGKMLQNSYLMISTETQGLCSLMVLVPILRLYHYVLKTRITWGVSRNCRSILTRYWKCYALVSRCCFLCFTQAGNTARDTVIIQLVGNLTGSCSWHTEKSLIVRIHIRKL